MIILYGVLSRKSLNARNNLASWIGRHALYIGGWTWTQIVHVVVQCVILESVSSCGIRVCLEKKRKNFFFTGKRGDEKIVFH